MLATIMDHLAEKQAEIESRRLTAATEYASLWRRMISEWLRPDEHDRAWLLYAANYLFRTAGVRWALDPLTLRQRLPSAPEVDISALAALDSIVLTHRHADHLDLDLLRCLRDYPIHWIVPDDLLVPLQILNLPHEKLTVPRPLEPIRVRSLTLTPFTGLHFSFDSTSSNGLRGVPEISYLVEFSGKRWLFPGDTRVYDVSQLPSFGSVDGVFAHVWLGRGCALEEEPPLMEAFCRFCLDLQPKRIVLAHLNELGRDASECWNRQHAHLIASRLTRTDPSLEVIIAQTGDGLWL